jgi:AraC-like DNA-binding protein
MNTIIEYILFLGGAEGLLLTLYLLNKKENVTANRILAITLFAYSIDILYALFISKKLYLVYPQFIGLNGPLPYIYSPSIFLYTHMVSSNKKVFTTKHLFHFIPAALMILITIPFFIFIPAEAKIALMNPATKKDLSIIIFRTIIPFYGISYMVLCIKDIKRYHIRLKENFSNIEKLKLDWLIYLIIGIALVWFMEFIQIILIDILGKPENIAYQYIYLTVSVLLYFVTYKSLSQPEIFSDIKLSDNEIKEEEKTTIYKKSGLTDDKAKQYLARLIEIMQKEKPYLNSDLSLSDLSSMLEISTHNLSEIINTQLSKTFYDFVNYYRVEEVKRLMNEDKKNAYSILAIAFDAGFNSKSSFNNIFKKTTGVTPSEYRKSTNKENPLPSTD